MFIVAVNWAAWCKTCRSRTMRPIYASTTHCLRKPFRTFFPCWDGTREKKRPAFAHHAMPALFASPLNGVMSLSAATVEARAVKAPCAAWDADGLTKQTIAEVVGQDSACRVNGL